MKRPIHALMFVAALAVFVVGVSFAVTAAPRSAHMETLDAILTGELSGVAALVVPHAGCDPGDPPPGYHYVGCEEILGVYWAEFHPDDPPGPPVKKRCTPPI